MIGRRRWSAVLVTTALSLVACGDGGVSTTAQDDASHTSTTVQDSDAGAGPAVRLADTSLGEALVDADGMTLYLFAEDESGKSNCTGSCAETWPPLTVEGEPLAGSRIDGGRLSTFDRGGGTLQVAYGGVPLYRYAPDEDPGDTKGHGVGGVWFVVGPDGEPIDGTTQSERGY